MQRALAAALLLAAEPLAAGAIGRGVCSLHSGASAARRAAQGAAARPLLAQGPTSRSQPWSPAQLQLLRQWGSAAEEEAASAAVHDTLRPKVLRFAALFMIAGAGLNVLPSVAAASVGNCLALLDATQPFMVKAGCSRLQLLMRAEAGRRRAVEEGAAAKLLRVVQQPGADEVVIDYAMAALEMLTGCEEGLLSLREEGGQAALESYLAGVQRTPATEDAVYRAQRLLDALQRLGDL